MNDNSEACPYRVRATENAVITRFFVVDLRRGDNLSKSRVSERFDTPDKAQRCIDVLIADDQRAN
jgi:hypothetical protein